MYINLANRFFFSHKLKEKKDSRLLLTNSFLLLP